MMTEQPEEQIELQDEVVEETPELSIEDQLRNLFQGACLDDPLDRRRCHGGWYRISRLLHRRLGC